MLPPKDLELPVLITSDSVEVMSVSMEKVFAVPGVNGNAVDNVIVFAVESDEEINIGEIESPDPCVILKNMFA